MLKLNVNAFECLGGGKFVHRGYGQNRFALVQRLHRERFFALLVGLNHRTQVGHAVGWGGKIVLSEDRSDSRHRLRFA